MRIKKYIQFKNPETGSITHKDKEKSGLEFKEIIRDISNNVIYLVKGEDLEINSYLLRHTKEAFEITETNTKTKYDAVHPIKTVPCSHCKGIGTDTIPTFEVVVTSSLY